MGHCQCHNKCTEARPSSKVLRKKHGRVRCFHYYYYKQSVFMTSLDTCATPSSIYNNDSLYFCIVIAVVISYAQRALKDPRVLRALINDMSRVVWCLMSLKMQMNQSPSGVWQNALKYLMVGCPLLNLVTIFHCLP
jgi:hypothetical protein